MGIFRRKIKQPIQGTMQIVRCSQPGNPRAIRSRCVMFVVIEAPGIEPTSVELRRQIEVARWPSPGMTLPCIVDGANPGRIDVDFKNIPDWQEAARSQAAQVAASRGAASGGSGMQQPQAQQLQGTPTVVIGAASPEAAADAIQRAERATGMDLNGDGQIG